MPPLSQMTQNWLFTEADLENTPSRSGGISLQDELARRKLTMQYMRSLAYRTDEWMGTEDPNRNREQGRHLRGLVTTASIFVHRFFMRRSLVDFDERLVAAAVLWIASKVEEHPFKLRFLVNAVLGKFHENDKSHAVWVAKSSTKNAEPSEGYVRWERRILAAEMIIIEALCFDFVVEQPWVVLRRSISGLDELVKEKYGPPAYARDTTSYDWRGNGANGVQRSNGVNGANGANRVDRNRPKMTESVATEVCWVILSEALNTPLCLLFPPSIIAFATFTLVISFVESIPFHTALAAAAEIGDKFCLDLNYTPRGATGSDVLAVEECLKKYVEYIKAGLIDEELSRYFVDTQEDLSNTQYSRRFTAKLEEDDEVAGVGGQNGVEEAKEGSAVGGQEIPGQTSNPSPSHLSPNRPSLPEADPSLPTAASSVRMTQSPVASNPASPSGSFHHSSPAIRSSPPATLPP